MGVVKRALDAVLPDPWQRIQALQHAARFVRPGGYLLVVTRSPADIGPRAVAANWPAHHDGYWSSEAKGVLVTFGSTGLRLTGRSASA